MKPISTQNAKHYNWGNPENSKCDGWHLVEQESLSVIQERMPPGTEEVLHYHEKAEQFFFILRGKATIIVEGETLELETHQGVHIPAGTPHQMKNLSDSDLHFTVTSTPPSHGDRVVLKEKKEQLALRTTKLNPKIKTVLVVGYVWPEPNSSAAGGHMLSLLKYFKSQDCRVVFSTPSQPTEHMIDLSDYEVESCEIALNSSSFDEFVSELDPQLVIYDRFMMEEQFGWRVEKSCPNAIRILDTEDLQSLRGARHEALKKGEDFTAAKMKLSDLAKREIAAIYRSDLSLIISDFELELLKNEFSLSHNLLHHLPFLIREQLELTSSPKFEERNHFVTIGNFRHAPNWDSVLFLQEIWPLIRKQLPDAELHIYGSYPPKKATQLNNPKTGFLVKGWVEDATEALRNARVVLAPLRFGAGIKGKLIDAMLSGTPSVTTDIGVEGMAGEFSWPGIVANSPQEIADAAIELYQSENCWRESQQRIEPLLAQRYDKGLLQEKLTVRINEIYSNLSAHRVNNFIGSMLLHHTMKSTQFMSQWIEAKAKLKSEH